MVRDLGELGINLQKIINRLQNNQKLLRADIYSIHGKSKKRVTRQHKPINARDSTFERLAQGDSRVPV